MGKQFLWPMWRVPYRIFNRMVFYRFLRSEWYNNKAIRWTISFRNGENVVSVSDWHGVQRARDRSAFPPRCATGRTIGTSKGDGERRGGHAQFSVILGRASPTGGRGKRERSHGPLCGIPHNLCYHIGKYTSTSFRTINSSSSPSPHSCSIDLPHSIHGAQRSPLLSLPSSPPNCG